MIEIKNKKIITYFYLMQKDLKKTQGKNQSFIGNKK